MDLTLLLNKLQKEKGLTLKDYKEGTLRRRIERRIKFDGANSLEEYIVLIDQDYHLYWRLISDLFIGVTDFFRDKRIWDIVSTQVLPEIVERRIKSELNLPLRMWSAGCSTGEETYSLAMMVKEFFDENNIWRLPAFIYGTDIMEDKLEEAKRGVYLEEKLAKVEEKLRERYFTREERPRTRDEGRRMKDEEKNHPSSLIPHPSYRVSQEIRQLTRFLRHDLVRDKDRYGFDMVVCRNVLIYFQKSLQDKVITCFYKALRPGGILWLGGAETIFGETETLFEPVFKREKIFRKL